MMRMSMRVMAVVMMMMVMVLTALSRWWRPGRGRFFGGCINIHRMVRTTMLVRTVSMMVMVMMVRSVRCARIVMSSLLFIATAWTGSGWYSSTVCTGSDHQRILLLLLMRMLVRTSGGGAMMMMMVMMMPMTMRMLLARRRACLITGRRGRGAARYGGRHGRRPLVTGSVGRGCGRRRTAAGHLELFLDYLLLPIGRRPVGSCRCCCVGGGCVGGCRGRGH